MYPFFLHRWPASKLSYLGKRSEPRENASEARSRETRFSLAQIGELARRLLHRMISHKYKFSKTKTFILKRLAQLFKGAIT